MKNAQSFPFPTAVLWKHVSLLMLPSTGKKVFSNLKCATWCSSRSFRMPNSRKKTEYEREQLFHPLQHKRSELKTILKFTFCCLESDHYWNSDTNVLECRPWRGERKKLSQAHFSFRSKIMHSFSGEEKSSALRQSHKFELQRASISNSFAFIVDERRKNLFNDFSLPIAQLILPHKFHVIHDKEN